MKKWLLLGVLLLGACQSQKFGSGIFNPDLDLPPTVDWPSQVILQVPSAINMDCFEPERLFQGVCIANRFYDLQIRWQIFDSTTPVIPLQISSCVDGVYNLNILRPNHPSLNTGNNFVTFDLVVELWGRPSPSDPPQRLRRLTSNLRFGQNDRCNGPPP